MTKQQTTNAGRNQYHLIFLFGSYSRYATPVYRRSAGLRSFGISGG